ncbi:hypothetical protein [Hymenobacter guriensis]|uniref:Uncharacterized protein n=1 Tax=Hymenobacter guriensis TaxID=2793065 RepID=A0ABS0L030_9BACT|nr:hypothetical protein [Hymenobacter guriensis]MBG8553466.1 hypothetical protein [Hymenobacter guriensis]
MGHYEGAVNMPGTGARIGLELRKMASGQLQAELALLGEKTTMVPLGTVRYRAPQLQLEQAGGFPGRLTISALREGDFLRGTLQLDSLRGEFVLVRRGDAAPRPWREHAVRLPGLSKAQSATFYVPDDTLTRHPVIVAWASATPAHLDQVLRLSQASVATLLLAPSAPADSAVAHATAAALQWLRRRPEADTTRLGAWGRGPTASEVAVAARRASASFLVLESVEVMDEAGSQPFRALGRARIPVFGFYAGRDTTLSVRESSRRLRQALGQRRGVQVRVFDSAWPGFYLPGRPAADGRWQWPQPTPGLWEGLEQWLRQLK